MTTAKKLLCGHLFHVHCLRSWLERQHTCPTCRAPIIPPDNGRAASARQYGAQPGVQPGELYFNDLIFFLSHVPIFNLLDYPNLPGDFAAVVYLTLIVHSYLSVSTELYFLVADLMWEKAAAGTGTPASEGAAGENMNRHQAKLQAAAAAASLYGRSFTYPPANTLNRYISGQSKRKDFMILLTYHLLEMGGYPCLSTCRYLAHCIWLLVYW
jgi:hypothetical protein